MVASIVCLCLDEPSSFIISNEALKAGDLELRFVNFQVPDTFHAGLPSGPFCVLGYSATLTRWKSSASN